VSSVEQAVSLLGIMRLKALVAAEHVFRALIIPARFTAFTLSDLWEDAFLVAESARAICKLEGQTGDRPDQAFMAGLLHDLGILLLVAQNTDAFIEVVEEARLSGRPMVAIERERFGTTHAEIGAYILGLWGLPSRIAEAVAWHHQPGDFPYDGMCAVTVVHAGAAFLSEWKHRAGAADPLGSEVDLAYLGRTGAAPRLDAWRAEASKLLMQSRWGEKAAATAEMAS
jgi:HD-like signal output (HDOD) protein